MSSGKPTHIFRTTTAIVVIALLGLIIWLFSRASNEPSYHGRSLSQWADQLDDHSDGEGVSWSPRPWKTPQQLEAVAAIRAIGTNAIPFLLEDMVSTDSAFYELKKEVADYFYRKAHPTRSLRQRASSPAEVTRWRGAQALECLGPLVEPSAPALQKLLVAGGGYQFGKGAAFVLGNMGPTGISLLTNAILTNAVQPNSEWVGISALWSLGQHPAAATNAVPFLVATVTHSNNFLAYGAVWALGEIRGNPELVLPAMISSLKDSRTDVRSMAAQCIGNYGAAAKSALVELKLYLDDPAMKPNVQQAILKIEGAKASGDQKKVSALD